MPQTDADRGLLSYLEKMGHVPFRYPTPDGYPGARASTGTPRCSGAGNSPSRWPTTASRARTSSARNSSPRSAATPRVAATLLNRQPSAEESDALIKSGDGLALLLASPAFQRC